jgi:hypothetical protein
MRARGHAPLGTNLPDSILVPLYGQILRDRYKLIRVVEESFYNRIVKVFVHGEALRAQVHAETKLDCKAFMVIRSLHCRGAQPDR